MRQNQIKTSSKRGLSCDNIDADALR